MSIRTDPWRNIKPKHGELAYVQAIDTIKHLLTDRDLDFLYSLKIEGIDRRGRILALHDYPSNGDANDHSRILKLISQSLNSSDWATGLVIQYSEPVSRKSSRFKNLFFLPPFFVKMTLPHSRVNGNEYWRKNGNEILTLVAETKIGLPYGTFARLILMYLTTLRVTQNKRRFLLGESWRDFLNNMQIPWGGRKSSGLHATQDQLLRLSQAKYGIFFKGVRHGRKLEDYSGILIADRWTRTGDGIRIALSESFFTLCGESVVPLQSHIILKLRRSSLLLDLYAWLSYRTYKTPQPSLIKWHQLELQFGSAYKRKRDFRAKFCAALDTVLAHNPVTPHVIVQTSGLRLEPGNPADIDWSERIQLLAKSKSL